MKKYLLLAFFTLVLGFSLFSLVGCSSNNHDSSSDQIEQAKQEELSKNAVNSVGLPNIKNFTELKNCNYIIEMRDKTDLITYAYTKSDLTGKWHFQHKGMGFGLPYATQRTNPMKIVRIHYPTQGYDNIVIPQSDPNKLFSPSSADATWQFVINRHTGKVELAYCEDKLNIFQSPQQCDNPQDVY